MRIVILLLAVVLAAPVAAQSEDVLAMCESIGESSDSIFTAKNSGLPLTELIRRINGAVDERGAIYDLTLEMVREIYGLPNYSTPQMQEQQASRYRASVELQCIETFINE